MSVAINDRFMLPKRVRAMEQMADLLQVEQTELTQLQHTIEALENQLIISTSTFLLPRHEKIFGLYTNTQETLDARRTKILAKLEGISMATPKMIRSVVERFIPDATVNIEEHNTNYFFEVKCEGVEHDPALSDLRDALDEVKPAHLVYGLTFTAKPIKTVAYIVPTLGQGYMLSPLLEAQVDYQMDKTLLHVGGAFGNITKTVVPPAY